MIMSIVALGHSNHTPFRKRARGCDAFIPWLASDVYCSVTEVSKVTGYILAKRAPTRPVQTATTENYRQEILEGDVGVNVPHHAIGASHWHHPGWTHGKEKNTPSYGRGTSTVVGSG